MSNLSASCNSQSVKGNKIWPYENYYLGEKDQEGRRHGHGNNYWTGAESLEWYTGRFVHDTMHGYGEYRWRYRKSEDSFITYEGHFYANRMHGYGTMSYPDGRVFSGLFYNDVHWGPGIESHACLREDVGLWRGTQLVRLAWLPPGPNVAIDLISSCNGQTYVESHRVILASKSKSIGTINSALDLLKQYKCEPKSASEKWRKVYPKYCTDLSSPLCHVNVFEHAYYKGKVCMLQEVENRVEVKKNEKHDSGESLEEIQNYYAWNNNPSMIHMMKQCFKHEEQRYKSGVDLTTLLSGPRTKFKPAGKHELDCRTLLMASYLGHITNVAQLLTEDGVYPDIADLQGNSTIMYATCGDHAEVIHFLVEAGANINSYNDSCCTPLGVALIRFACIRNDITANGMVQALLPAPVSPVPATDEQNVFDWNLMRNLSAQSPEGILTKSQSKTAKLGNTKKKSFIELKDLNVLKNNTKDCASKMLNVEDGGSFPEEERLYTIINNEYLIRINDYSSLASGANPIPYIFEINDMVKEIISGEEEQKRVQEKNPKKMISKTLKDTIKPSKDIMWQGTEKDECALIDDAEKQKSFTLDRIMSTILQLLSDGANPKLVHCPQPALFIAIVARCSDLVLNLIDYGVDVNEVFIKILGYTPLDIAISREFNLDNLNIIRILLQNGARTCYRLQYRGSGLTDQAETLGPTLFHAVLARKTENEVEEDIRYQILELLLEYNCDPTVQFKGRSAIDIAMTKSIDLLDIFVKSPTTSLNAVINDSNQSVLVKMFSMPFFRSVGTTERLTTVTNLLLYGADPFLECQNGEDKFLNIFVFAKKTLADMENLTKMVVSTGGKADAKSKKGDKQKKDEKLIAKSVGRTGGDDVGDYKQAIDLVTECARMLYIRWLQAKLMKDLIEIVAKYKHRQWNMILKEHKDKERVALWLNPHRCLEIWDILSTNKRRIYHDTKTLKYTLCIIQYYCKSTQSAYPRKPITVKEKETVETTVNSIMHEHKTTTKLSSEIVSSNRQYVKPELTTRRIEKFNVCFECGLPLNEDKILCNLCKLISFCSFECVTQNVDRTNCHPCSSYLKEKYFYTPDESLSKVLDHNY